MLQVLVQPQARQDLRELRAFLEQRVLRGRQDIPALQVLQAQPQARVLQAGPVLQVLQEQLALLELHHKRAPVDPPVLQVLRERRDRLERRPAQAQRAGQVALDPQVLQEPRV